MKSVLIRSISFISVSIHRTSMIQINTDEIRSYPFNQFYQCIYPYNFDDTD